jgi:flagellar biosynthetic protein FliO
MQCFLLFIFFIGDEAINGISVEEGQNYNFISEFVNMLVTLVFVLILIFVSVWLLKKIMRSRTQTLNRSNGIKILERRPLNQKASLYLLDILGKGVVIAESQAGIQVITQFEENVRIEELYGQLKEDKAPSLSFGETLAKKLRRSSTKDV